MFTITNIEKYRDHAKRILKEPMPEYLIKQRDGGGGIKLDYVEGSTVIRKLNAAFDNMWEWEITSFQIVPSEPKKITKKWNQQQRRMVDLPEPIFEEQPPVAHVLGKLTVPGFGMRMGFGSKPVIGGASEQESCFKAASTDALKKAATLFGIALELYEDEPIDFEIYDEEPYVEEIQEAPAPSMPARGGVQIPPAQEPKKEEPKAQPKVQAESFDMTVFQQIQQLSKELGLTSSAPLADYISEMTGGKQKAWGELSPEQLPQLKDYLQGLVNELNTQIDRLGLQDISGLHPYVKDFSEGVLTSFENLNPTHLRTFIIYLERQ